VFSNRQRTALAIPALSSAVVLFTAACGEDPDSGPDYTYRTQDEIDAVQEPPPPPQPQTVYCTTADGEIVSEDLCDPALDGDGDDTHYSGSSFILLGNYGSPGSHRVGERLPIGSGTQIHPGDTAARTRVGLPPAGRVSAGQVPPPRAAPAPDPGRAAPAPRPNTRVQGGIGSGPQGGTSGRGSGGGAGS
jgi:hypothetical protein